MEKRYETIEIVLPKRRMSRRAKRWFNKMRRYSRLVVTGDIRKQELYLSLAGDLIIAAWKDKYPDGTECNTDC